METITIHLIYLHLQNQFKNAFKDVFGVDLSNVDIEFPPNVSLGSFTISCFKFSKRANDSPPEIAKKIAQKINKTKIIETVSNLGPYINFQIYSNILVGTVCEEVILAGESFSVPRFPTNEKIMVEYLSPNTNKPLHLGHVRNGILGEAISNLLEAVGHEVVRANLINDRGIAICKSMLAYDKWGERKTPLLERAKGDHFVGNFYVLYAQKEKEDPSIKKEAQEFLTRWENGDPRITELWKLMNSWVLSGFEQTYRKFGFSFDVVYYESETYKLGKDVIEKGLSTGLFEKLPNNTIVARLPIDKFGKDESGNQKIVTLVRSDGTSVYMTQDLGTAVQKFKEHHLNQSIHIVGKEQKHHFKCLFFLLKELGFSWVDKCYHTPYGMVYLPEGKMKSREGKVVDADDLAKKMEVLAQEQMSERSGSEIISEEIESRARKIGMAAIKFYLLRVNSEKDIYFNPKESLSFEGNTGPYCQYAYARAKSILRKKEAQAIEKNHLPDFSLLTSEKELLVIRFILQLPEAIKKSAERRNPSILCDWVYGIAKIFSQFYHSCQVIGDDIPVATASARIKLVRSFAIAIKQGLDILDIETIDEM